VACLIPGLIHDDDSDDCAGVVSLVLFGGMPFDVSEDERRFLDLLCLTPLPALGDILNDLEFFS